MRVLVTGGTGFIGSHTCVELINAGHSVVVFDNFTNSSKVSLDRVQQITSKPLTYFKGDLRSAADLERVFQAHQFDAVIHLAGLKAVAESIEKPLEYYHNNVEGTLNLLSRMVRDEVRQLIFSSSATVYKPVLGRGVRETDELGPINPYGRSKLMVEDILRDLSASTDDWFVSILRYFNPVGAHVSGLIGENPLQRPGNLMPAIASVATGRSSSIDVFGIDYPTRDGSGVRDFIHVQDLAAGHVAALARSDTPGVRTYNLGTGRGCSVLELISTFQKVSGVNIPYRITSRREGDLAECYSDPSAALKALNWQAVFTLEDMCRDTWRWLQFNPNGYM